jgi:hypothetical protein
MIPNAPRPSSTMVQSLCFFCGLFKRREEWIDSDMQDPGQIPDELIRIAFQGFGVINMTVWWYFNPVDLSTGWE